MADAAICFTGLRRWDCPAFEPFGAFYVFPCIKEFGMTSEEFATELLNQQKLAVVPGTAFGDCGEGFLRISYAYSLDNLKKAMDRMEAFITDLRKIIRKRRRAFPPEWRLTWQS